MFAPAAGGKAVAAGEVTALDPDGKAQVLRLGTDPANRAPTAEWPDRRKRARRGSKLAAAAARCTAAAIQVRF